MSKETKHIIVLVAGTVDPICLSPNELKRAASYDSDNNYWAENKAFIQSLKALCNQYSNLALFDAHGWSGDNTKENREIAGAYLANRLCGSNGEAAYYEGYKRLKVAYHLIGHSHGGNVLNEFTKRAAIAPEWPEHWHIKSVTYLSTPFFKYQHILDCTKLSDDCRIVNVTNDFDLTQRVIADFSMYDLVSAWKLAHEHTPAMMKAISEIKKTAFMAGINKFIEVFSEPSALKLLFDSADYKLSKADGKSIYEATIKLLSNVETALSEFKLVVDKLNSSIYYPSDSNVDHLNLESTRHFVSEQLRAEIDKLADNLINDIHQISHALNKRNKKSDYSVTPLLGDVAPELNRIIDFFSLNVGDAKGPFINIFYSLLMNQIENFDNTRTTPSHQITAAFKSQLFNIDVSDKDDYYQLGDIQGFNDFIKQLENTELAYENEPTQKNLLKICVTMLAPQTELASFKSGLKATINKLDTIFGTNKYSLKRFTAHLLTLRGNITPIRKLAIRLQTLLKSYDHLIREFDIALIKPIEQGDHEAKEITNGTLAHFAVVSHSVSRQQLHPEIIEVLKPQFETDKEVAKQK